MEDSAEAKFLARLRENIKRSQTKHSTFRTERKKLIKAFTGRTYQGASVDETRVFNFAYQAVSVLLPLIVARNPEPDITTLRPELRPTAYDLELACSNVLRRLNARNTVRLCLADAIFLMGISRVDLADSANAFYANGRALDLGSIIFENIGFDDWFIDPDAKRIEAAMFEGHLYDMPTAELRDGPYKNVPERIGENNEKIPDAAEDITKKKPTGERLLDMTRMADIYIPASNPWGGKKPVIVTIIAGEELDKPNRVRDWKASPRGPYEHLGHLPVPDNLIPMSPAMGWGDLDDLINAGGRKIHNQIKREKSIFVADQADAQDAVKIRNSVDGDVLVLTNPAAMTERKISGMDESMWRVLGGAMEYLNKQSGNISMKGGIARETETLGVAQMLQQNINTSTDDFQDEAYNFVSANFEKVAYFVMKNPKLKERIVRRVKGTPIEIATTLTRADLEGDFADYEFKIRAHSMAPSTPERRYASFLEFIERIILPLSHLGMAQGLAPDIVAFAEWFKRERGLDDMDEVFKAVPPAQIEPYRTVGRPSNNKIVKAPQGAGMTGGAMQTPMPMGAPT